MITICKADKKFKEECIRIKNDVLDEIKRLEGLNTSILKGTLNDLRELVRKGEKSEEELTPLVIAIICRTCEILNPESLGVNYDKDNLFNAIAFSKRILLNHKMKIKDKQFALLCAVIIHTLNGKTVHIATLGDAEDDSLYSCLEYYLKHFNITCALIDGNDDERTVCKNFESQVVFGSYESFMKNSLCSEAPSFNRLISRDTVIITDITLIIKQYYNISWKNIGGGIKLNVISPRILFGRYALLLGCSPVLEPCDEGMKALLKTAENGKFYDFACPAFGIRSYKMKMRIAAQFALDDMYSSIMSGLIKNRQELLKNSYKKYISGSVGDKLDEIENKVMECNSKQNLPLSVVPLSINGKEFTVKVEGEKFLNKGKIKERIILEMTTVAVMDIWDEQSNQYLDMTKKMNGGVGFKLDYLMSATQIDEKIDSRIETIMNNIEYNGK